MMLALGLALGVLVFGALLMGHARAVVRAYRAGLERGGELYAEVAKPEMERLAKVSFDNGFNHGVDRLTAEFEKVIPEKLQELKEHWTAVQRAQGEGIRRSN